LWSSQHGSITATKNTAPFINHGRLFEKRNSFMCLITITEFLGSAQQFIHTLSPSRTEQLINTQQHIIGNFNEFGATPQVLRQIGAPVTAPLVQASPPRFTTVTTACSNDAQLATHQTDVSSVCRQYEDVPRSRASLRALPRTHPAITAWSRKPSAVIPKSVESTCPASKLSRVKSPNV
jgi:hypothetical protein